MVRFPPVLPLLLSLPLFLSRRGQISNGWHQADGWLKARQVHCLRAALLPQDIMQSCYKYTHSHTHTQAHSLTHSGTQWMQNQVRQMPTRLRNAIHIAYAVPWMNEWIISTKQLCEVYSLSVLGIENVSDYPRIYMSLYPYIHSWAATLVEAHLTTLNF